MKNLSLKNGKAIREVTISESGILTGFQALQFKKRVEKALLDDSHNIFVDLSETTLVDLSCVNTLLIASKISKRKNISIRVISKESNGLKRWLHLIKFEGFLNIQYLAA